MAGKDRRANGSAADDAEFERLLDEMDELGRQADALRAKVNHLIDEMRENDVPADEESDGVAGGETHGTASDEEADGVAADEESDGVAVDEESDGVAADEGAAADDEAHDAGDGDVALDADNAAAGKAIDEDGEPDAT